MNKLCLIKNPELFQGEKYLKKNKNYFEGWYFKNTFGSGSIAFIPGISISNNRKVFIQVITNDVSYFIDYDISDFKYNHNPFWIKIGNNVFSKDSIHIDIKDKKQNLKIYGDIKYLDNKQIKKKWHSPNIMGPFSYVPFMQCNHAIISMKNKANGVLTFNDKKIKINNGIGYIEKDWGISFPKTYIWCQANNFKSDASFMLSIANVPFKLLSFRGLICVLIIDKKEYRFTTYNMAKTIKYDVQKNCLDIILKKGHYILNVKTKSREGLKLSAPVKGKMYKDILESLTAYSEVILKKDNLIIFHDTSLNCGMEIVDD